MAVNTTIQLTESLKQTWEDAFEAKPSMGKLQEGSMRDATTMMLEMQLAEGNSILKTKERLAEFTQDEQEGRDLFEETQAGDVAKWDPILISMVRRAAPSLVAHDLMGVQPLTGPTGLIFAMKSFYGGRPTGTEMNTAAEPNINFAGANYDTESNTARSQGVAYKKIDEGKRTSTANLEQMGVRDRATANAGNTVNDAAWILKSENIWPEVSFKIERISVSVESRMLKGKYTDELTADLKAIHGLNARDEIAKIMSTELTAEMNRESVSILLDQAVIGAQNTATKGFFDLDVDADGRWSIEKYKGLLLQINREAHEIAKTTRRGVGNVIVTSSNVVSALDMAGVIDKSITTGAMNIDGVGTTYAGVLNGRFKVFLDPYATVDYVVVGYKGSNVYDAGVIYSPYVPFTVMEAKDSESFQPVIGFKSRYAYASNPFVGDGSGKLGAGTRGQNSYYRKFVVRNL